MRFHAQNLHDRHGSIWTYGRCWWNLTERVVLKAEWQWWSKSLHLDLDLATHDNALSLAVCCWVFSLYLTLDYAPWHNALAHLIKRRDEKYGSGRVIGVSWYDGRLVVNLWDDPMESRGRDPWWWSFSIVPVDVLFGRSRYRDETIGEHRVEIPMPEGVYPGTVRLFESTWTRARWLWPRRGLRAEITPDTPIPHPGKGENSWDCGEDATHSLTCQASTTHDAVGEMVKAVLRSRYRYGGLMWRPANQQNVTP